MHLRKTIQALEEPEKGKGGLTRAEVRKGLQSAVGHLDKWGLGAEIQEWGMPTPTADECYNALFDGGALEWNRIGAFQAVTMRLLAQTLLPPDHLPVYVHAHLAYDEVPSTMIEQNAPSFALDERR